MSALADIFTAVRLTLDGSGFEAQATALADSQGKNIGDRMSSQLSSKLKSAVLGGIGALAGAGFAAAITGANQLDAATKQLQADTGMTATEAGIAEKAIADMYRNNLQGMDQIGAAMAVVINGLELTGTAADDMTAKFLAFATATGQDAAPAVSSFHEILNAWNLDASAAAGIMDQLVVSHQKYGGSIADNEASLRTLAPQMQALGMNINDTIGLLNLFDQAGMDSAKATFALNTAVQKLKPGQTLNDLIAEITAIEDPTLRAQKAVEIFGARGGVNLANALRPGISGLQDFEVSASDAAGATDRAAAAVESGFGAQATLMIHNFTGALADLSTNFGSILVVAALVGPRLATALLAGLGGVLGLMVPKMAASLYTAAGLAPWMTAGTAIGTTLGAAAEAALFLAVPISIAAILTLARDEWKKQTEGWGFGVPDLFTGQGPTAGAPVAGVKVPTKPYNVADTYLPGAYDTAKAAADAAKAAKGAVDTAINPLDAYLGSALGQAFRSGEREALPRVILSVQDLIKLYGTALVSGVVNAAKVASSDGMAALAQGISDARNKPVDAFNTMLEMLKTPETAAQEAARLAGGLTSQALKDGLESKDPEIKAQSIAVKRMIVDRLQEIVNEGGTLGKDAMSELVKGMASKDDDVAYASKVVYDLVMDKLNATKADAGTAGENAAIAFANGLSTLKGRLPSWLSDWLGITSSTPTTGGRAAGGPVTAGMPYIVGERRPELFVPQTNGYVLPSVPAGSGVAVNIERVDIANAHDEFSLVQSLRFLAQVTG